MPPRTRAAPARVAPPAAGNPPDEPTGRAGTGWANSKRVTIPSTLVTVIAFLIGVVLLVVGLAVSIALHEIGHLVPAKKFGVRVGQYMIGFGPTLWSRRIGETEYGVKALPLGGYISMAGMYPPSPDATATAELEESFSGRHAFGTAGLRGRHGCGPTRMNRVVVSQTSAGFAAFLLARAAAGETSSPPSVVIGYDGRVNSEVFARDAAGSLWAASSKSTLSGSKLDICLERVSPDGQSLWAQPVHVPLNAGSATVRAMEVLGQTGHVTAISRDQDSWTAHTLQFNEQGSLRRSYGQQGIARIALPGALSQVRYEQDGSAWLHSQDAAGQNHLQHVNAQGALTQALGSNGDLRLDGAAANAELRLIDQAGRWLMLAGDASANRLSLIRVQGNAAP